MTATAVSLIQRLHFHRDWVNQNLLAAAADLSREQLLRPFAIGQGSIWKTLTHMFAAEYAWLAALSGVENPLVPGDGPGIHGNQQGPEPISDVPELRRRWSELQARWEAYLANLSAESLDDLVPKVNSLTGVRAVTKRLDVLLHVCTHAQYTAAQAINMLRQVGVEKLPETMLITLARAESQSRSASE